MLRLSLPRRFWLASLAANGPRPNLITETKVRPRRWFDVIFREELRCLAAFHLYPVLLVLLIVVMLTTSSPAQKKGSRITVGTVGVFVYAALAWKRRFWGLFGRPHYSLVALSMLSFVALLACYNLLGFQF